MSTENKEENKQGTGEGGGEKTDQQQTPPAKTEDKDKVKVQGTEGGEKVEEKKTEGGGENKEPRRVQLKEETDEIPGDADLIEMSPKLLAKRLARASRKELRERFGTDNPDDIKAKLDKLAEYEKADEERKRQSMTEIEREKSDRVKAEKRAQDAERRLQAVYDARTIATEEDRIVKLAKDAGMDEDYIEDQFPKLARFLNENYTDKQLRKLKDDVIKNWFADRIKTKPKLAREGGGGDKGGAAGDKDKADKDKKDAKPKVGLNNGVQGTQPKPGADQVANTEKTFKPGQKNSMTRGEARAEMRKLGIQY